MVPVGEKLTSNQNDVAPLPDLTYILVGRKRRGMKEERQFKSKDTRSNLVEHMYKFRMGHTYKKEEKNYIK